MTFALELKHSGSQLDKTTAPRLELITSIAQMIQKILSLSGGLVCLIAHPLTGDVHR